MGSKKINEEDMIYNLTGLNIGKAFYKDDEYDVYALRTNSKSEQIEDGYIYDVENCNFHFLPILKDEKEVKKWEKYQVVVKEVRESICKKLEKRGIIALGKGKNGSLSPKPKYYELNGLFRCICVEKNNRYYSMNFIRWYIDLDNKVNCRFGEIQFDTSADGNINHNHRIVYPHCYKGQNEKMIRLDSEGACVYNPIGVDNIFNLDDESMEELVESFKEFIKKIEDELA